MKIAIITLPLHTNYGGVLQAYALQTILQRKGHEVVVIDKKWNTFFTPFYRFPFSFCKRLFMKYVLHRKNTVIFLERRLKKERASYCSDIVPFFERYLRRLPISDFDRFPEERFDAYVVGSDQIWRPIYYKGWFHNMADAFLLFARNQKVKRIAYAASFGTDIWEYSIGETEKCRKLIQLFDAVSVREKTGISLCSEYLGCEAKWVLDPTMLLNPADYLSLVDKANIPQSEGNLFVYILDRTADKDAIVNEVAQDLSLSSFECLARSVEGEYVLDPIEKWLRAFSDAEFIVTDSFHACAFSILFRKPFLVIGNKERGMARFTSLLELFKISDRLVYSSTDFQEKKELLLLSIDYVVVHEILRREKEKSMEFLINELNK